MEVPTPPTRKTSMCLTLLPSRAPAFPRSSASPSSAWSWSGRSEPKRAVLARRVAEDDRWCRRCGREGSPWDSVTRHLAHVPFGWRPTTLLVTVRRYRCTGRGHVWRQDTSKAAEPRARLSRRALRWALESSGVPETGGFRPRLHPHSG
jgi:hypothetical protein